MLRKRKFYLRNTFNELNNRHRVYFHYNLQKLHFFFRIRDNEISIFSKKREICNDTPRVINVDAN